MTSSFSQREKILRNPLKVFSVVGRSATMVSDMTLKRSACPISEAPGLLDTFLEFLIIRSWQHGSEMVQFAQGRREVLYRRLRVLLQKACPLLAG
jgi:hypothetical protein